MKIEIHQLENARDLPLPRYETEGAAGMDLRAALQEPLLLCPGNRIVVPTGIKIALPEGYEGQVRPRSGLAARHGIGMLNAPGTIDSDYRGEISVILMHWGESPYEIQRGERIAQLVICPVERAEWTVTNEGELSTTPRGSGGFGHTGGKWTGQSK